MHACLDLVFRCDPGHERSVTYMTVIKWHVFVHGGTMAATQVIDDNNRFTLLAQSIGSRAPYVSRTACHQNWHRSHIPQKNCPDIMSQSSVTVAPENKDHES